MLLRLICLLFSCLLFSSVAIAVECSVLFPGSNPFGTITSLNSDSEFKSSSQCNGSTCQKSNVETVSQARLPTIPTGGSNNGEFKSNNKNLTDQEYNFFNSWKDNHTEVLFDDSSGTAVVYITSTNDIIIPNNTEINVAKLPENMLLVLNSTTKIEIGADSNIKSFLYMVAPEVKINERVTINGAITVDTDKLIVEVDSVFNYTTGSLDNFVPHNFCEGASPPADIIPILDYRFDECSYDGTTGEVIDQLGSFHGTTTGVPDPVDDTIVNQSLDLSATGTSDWIDVPKAAVNGLDDFSVSVWIKTSVSKPSQTIFHALGNNSNDDELVVYLKSSTNVRVKVHGVDRNLNAGKSLTDNAWHHIVVTRQGKNICLFVDGIQGQCKSNSNSGVLSVPSDNSVVIGQERTDFSDSFDSNNGYDGKLDEFKIYDSKLESADIAAIYQNELAAKNYDGTDRGSSSCPPSLELHFEFNEGNGQDVVDSSGNGHDGIFGNGTSPESAYPTWQCEINSGFSMDFDKSQSQFISVPSFTPPSETTVAFWMRRSTIPISRERIFGFATDWEIQHENTGALDFDINIGTGPRSATVISDIDTWIHIAAVFSASNNTYAIYINGVLDSSGSATQNPVSAEILTIGNRTGREGSDAWNGELDDFRIYSGLLDASAIAALAATAPADCPPAVDHFEIDTLDQQGLTCQADNIIIKACADAACTSLNSDIFFVDLLVNGVVNRTINGSGGSFTTNYAYSTVGNAALSLDQTYQCTNTPTAGPCNVDFKDSGFVFSNIPTQLSAKPSDTGYNGATLSLQAVETDTGTGACVGAFPDGGDIPVNLSYSCDNGTCTDNLVLTNNNEPHNITTTPSAKTLLFGTDSTAIFALNYPDAARLMLNAQKDVEVIDSEGNIAIKDFSASSNAFVERPFAFYIDVVGNPKAQTANQVNSAFRKAGANFTATLTAVQWQSGEDTDNDGVADIGSDLSDNPTTVNFGNEASAETAKITHNLVLPNPGTLGNLTNVNFVAFTSGSASVTNMTYDEVGIINFTANLTDNSYLGADDIVGNEPYVGRFIPDHFELTSNEHGSIVSVCLNGDPDMPFAYSGQVSKTDANKGVLQYLAQPLVLITPLSTNDTHTLNYTGDFNKLLLSGVSRYEVDDGSGTMVLAPIVDAAQLGVDTLNKVKVVSNLEDALLTETNAVLSYEYSDEDSFIYVHEQNSEIAPFPADIQLSIASVIDEDGVTADDADDDPDGITGPILEADTVITLNPTGQEIRFGRAYLENSFGPETANLPQPFSVQYLNNTGNYVVNELDTCTDFDSANITLTTLTLDEGLTGTNSVTGHFDDDLPNGESRAMVLTAPGAGKQGQVGVQYNIYSWLEYDWDWNGVEIKVFDEDPSAIATFGLFRGNDRIIYWRELNN